MKKLWKKGSISDKVREYQSYDQLEDLTTDYRESGIDALLTYNDAYGFCFYVAAWIAPRLDEFRQISTGLTVPQHWCWQDDFRLAVKKWDKVLEQMQFSFDTIAGLNKGNLDKLVKEGTLTRAEIDMKVKKGLFLFAMYLQDLEY